MFSKNLLLLSIVLLLSHALAEDKSESSTPNSSNRGDFKKSLSRDCATSYSTTCLKLDIVSWVDKLNEEDNYSVLPGVSVVRENSSARSNTADIVAELARDFPNDPDARLDAFLLKKISGYLSSHSVRLNLWDNTAVESARGGGGGGIGGGGGGGGGGGKGGGGGMHIILAAAAMMKGTLMALALGGLAAVAGKALMAALVSLLLSTIIGLKSLTHHGHKQTTYEVISKPVYSHASSHSVSHEDHGHGYGHSSYGRSFDAPMALPLALQDNYKPPTE